MSEQTQNHAVIIVLPVIICLFGKKVTAIILYAQQDNTILYSKKIPL